MTRPVPPLPRVPGLDGALARLSAAPWWETLAAAARGTVRYVSQHTGLPALVVAAVLVALGYRLLRRSARFAVEVLAIGAALLAATQLGWIRW